MLREWITGLRALAYLKRMSASMESQAESLATLARIEQDRWEREFAPRPRGKFVVGTLDQKAANEYYRELHRDEFSTERD